MKSNLILFRVAAIIGFLLFCTYSAFAQIEWIETTNTKPWVQSKAKFSRLSGSKIDAEILPDKPEQIVEGFGVCFNELGWTALSVLDENCRDIILKKLFDPAEGLKLNICRMPIGANDYARDYYSLNDSAGDFKMKYFSIERDKEILIPFIKGAMKYRPDLKIWGSPWTPPFWMKTNNHYACSPSKTNGLASESGGKEGVTQFRMDTDYLNSYANYFIRFIQAYRNEGINITGIHVQNEMNSCQSFPSCIWSAKDLGIFIGKYLGPAVNSFVPGTQIWYGTYERPSVENIDTIIQDPVSSGYISGVSFQWAGKQAIAGVHKKYPDLKLMQSETECGNGSNDWKSAEYTFSLMKLYFENGVSVYSFWNSILDETGKSRWGWKQNSMITVNSATKTITYNPEFYLLKHFSYFVEPGARKLMTSGDNSELLAFINPDKSLIVIIENKEDASRITNLQIGKSRLRIQLQPHSFNTLYIQPQFIQDKL